MTGMRPRARPSGTTAVTQADVARLAGVSTAVVSYTLNNGPRTVAPETAERVRRAIAQLGYRPNLAARTLRMGSSRTLGLVLPDISNPFFGALGKAIERNARSRGLDVIMCNTGGTSPLLLIQHLDALQVAGVVLAGDVAATEEPEIHRLATPIVQLDAFRVIAGGISVGADLYEGARIAVRHLLDLGHETVAFLGPVDPAHPRYAGWLDALRAAGAPPGRAAATDFSREGGFAGATRLVEQQLPTAVFASSDLIAIGALLAFRRAGVSVPEEVVDHLLRRLAGDRVHLPGSERHPTTHRRHGGPGPRGPAGS